MQMKPVGNEIIDNKAGWGLAWILAEGSKGNIRFIRMEQIHRLLDYVKRS